MPSSSWLIGSAPNMPAQSMEVTAGGDTETIVVAATGDDGGWYLDDWQSSRSYLSALETALETHSRITTATIHLGRDRLVHFAFDTATAIEFTDTEGRDLIGMNGDFASATSGVADTVSRWLWVPDRPENPSAMVGRDGDTVYDETVSVSPGAQSTIVATGFNTREYNDFDFRFVPNAYFDTASDTNNGGQWRAFYDRVIRRFRLFKLYRGLLHDEADTTDVGLLASRLIGPYKLRHTSGPLRFRNEREIRHVDRLHRVRLPVVVATEYS